MSLLCLRYLRIRAGNDSNTDIQTGVEAFSKMKAYIKMMEYTSLILQGLCKYGTVVNKDG